MSEFMTFLMSYETLRAVWWLFLGVLLIGFAPDRSFFGFGCEFRKEFGLRGGFRFGLQFGG